MIKQLKGILGDIGLLLLLPMAVALAQGRMVYTGWYVRPVAHKCRNLLVAVLAALLLATPAFATIAYRASLTVTETSGTSYTQLPVIVSVNNTYLAANDYISSNGLDTAVETLAGAAYPHLVA